MRSRRHRALVSVVSVAGGAAGLGLFAAMGAIGSARAELAAPSGRPPAPGRTGIVVYLGGFADPRWRGEIRIVPVNTGRAVAYVSGIAPGTCQDRDFGTVIPGRDGATGVLLELRPSPSVFPIRANGDFVAKGRNSAFPSPFDAGRKITVTGTFSGNSVSGRVRASYRTSFDSCTANVAFTARRVAG
jgi:hypothetical protein